MLKINIEKIKKSDILVNELELWEKYLGVSSSVILQCINENKKIRNPYRDDNDPSLGFIYSHNKIYAKDFAGYFQGDIFDLVGGILNLNPKNSQDFIKILLELKNNKNLHDINYVKPKIKEYITGGNALWDYREWNHYDKSIFNPYKILDFETLQSEFVFPLQYFEYGKYVYTYKPKDPAYIYLKGNNKFQVYFPKRPKKGKYPRFITNSGTLPFGLHDYNTNYDTLLLTKSNKDRIIAKLLVNKFTSRILVLALPAESIILPDKVINKLKEDFNSLFTLFDNDRQGKYLSGVYRNLGFTPLLFNEIINDVKIKDCGEFVTEDTLSNIYSKTKLILNKYEKI